MAKPTKQQRAERLAARSAGSGLRGRWTGKRLFATARKNNAISRRAMALIAGTPEHPLCERAKLQLADWWGEDHESRVRQAVVETGAVAREGYARLRTLALLGRLAENWDESDVQTARRLLADYDPDVRLNAAAACRAATGAMHEALWDEAVYAGDPLEEILLELETPPPARQLDRLWAEWFEDPADRPGDALFRWARPPSDTRPVAAAITESTPPDRAALLYALILGDAPLRAAAEKLADPPDREFVEELCERVLLRPEAAGFCVERELAPGDPARRALFYVITRQWAQHAALDPDGRLLALAYASAAPAVRARARDAMLASGELDLVRVIVGEDRRARMAEMPREEARYLAERLAERREWDELWAFVRDLPISLAAELVRLTGRWSPRQEDEHRYFRALRDTDPATLDEGIARLPERPPLEPYAVLRLPDQYILGLSFSPDAPFLAVAGIGQGVSVIDLRTARPVQRYEEHSPRMDRVLHVGDGVVIAHLKVLGQEAYRLLRYADGAPRPVRTTAHPVKSLALTGDDGSFAACTADGELVLVDSDGEVRTLHPTPSGHPPPDRITAHRESGRIVALGDPENVHLIEPAAPSVTAVPTAEPVARAVFLDADTLLCKLESGVIARMTLPDGRTGPPSQTKQLGSAEPHALPRTGEAVFICVYGELHVYSGDPPERVHVRPSPDDNAGVLAVSPDGSLLAAGYRTGRIDLFDLRPRELAAVVRRPATALKPRDLRLLTDTLDTATTLAPETRTALELLRTALEHRFRFDIELGDAVRLAPGEHDISL
ncbi:hypothetical protein BJF79_31155 [Actinomadura sp. CNU-125]|uniref:WD40 repeat domain-containing protein n=1 Tax=Actinomadura sp. CNU-125 TaxID=1904961 RepID=UPI00095C9DA8|nr:WD40 repeat domain-containing protein [Actinomadura sp. CNU-125]OLT36512.1 hypothetical protein BJF79_31155 [Actinomadura sp. CNU-125]